jgi:predicted enzyme related to lactoylglutathione lyase
MTDETPTLASIPATPSSTSDLPIVFRLKVEVADLDAAVGFYSTLLGTVGRRQAGSRCYFTCGSVTLQVLDVSGQGAVRPLPDSLYFTVHDLDTVFERAQDLHCLVEHAVHDAPGGEIAVRPWGERSFYVEDPWGNALCFVEAGTVYEG